MTPSLDEHSCVINAISPDAISIISGTTPAPGQKIIVYVDEIGRLEGIVQERKYASFLLKLELSDSKKQTISRKLASIRPPSDAEVHRRAANDQKRSKSQSESPREAEAAPDDAWNRSDPPRVTPSCDAPRDEHIDETVLCCRRFGVAFGSRVILADVSFNAPSRGVTVLMGPAGTGKSTLLRSLAGTFGNNRIYKSWGEALFRNAPVSLENAPPLVAQRIDFAHRSVLESLLLHFPKKTLNASEKRSMARSWLDGLGAGEIAEHFDTRQVDLEPVIQRKVAILREAAAEPPVLLIDEPTSGLRDDDANDVLSLIERIASRSPALVVLHNQKQARRIARDIILLAGGRVIEHSPVGEFFTSTNAVTAVFVATGSCAVPAPDAAPETLSDETAAPPALPLSALTAIGEASCCAPEDKPPTGAGNAAERRAIEVADGRRGYAWLNALSPVPNARAARVEGFHWIIPGRLAGTSGPGVVHALDYDLDLLQGAGVTTLVTLTEGNLPQEALASHGLQNLHLPIPDGSAPALEDAEALVQGIRTLIETDHVVAVHCLQGIGRTGVVLACCLVDGGGMSAQAALARLRSISPAYLKTKAQEQFLAAFALRRSQQPENGTQNVQ